MDNQPLDAQQKPPLVLASGVRMEWEAVPEDVRAALAGWLGSPVVSAVSQRGGFSPGAAARITCADGRRVFVKAAGPHPQPHMPATLRREGRIVAGLPATAPVPRLLWQHDEGGEGWVALAFEDIQGEQPPVPWQPAVFERVLEAITGLGAALTPSPLPAELVPLASEVFASSMNGWNRLRVEQPSRLDGLDRWSLRHLDRLAALEAEAPAAVAGDTLLHFDLRADNMLLADGRVWFVDWPLACVGAEWVDVVFFAPSVSMQGGPEPEQIMARSPSCRAADPRRVTAAVAAVAGFFTHRSLQPVPDGLPTVRAFQAAQGQVARRWLAQRR